MDAYRLFWKPYGRNALCWAFYVVSDNTQVDGKVPQMMHYMICHSEYVLFTSRIKLRIKHISYFKSNGITTLKKHVGVEYTLLTKKFEEEVNNPMKNGLEIQPTKKKPNVSAKKNFKFFSTKDPLKRMMMCINYFFARPWFASC